MAMKPVGAGKSSIDLVDWAQTLNLLNLTSGQCFLDLACGSGRYSLALAEEVGCRGKIYAVDLWEEGLKQLQAEAQMKQVTWIKTCHTDIANGLLLAEATIDSGLLATALHDFAESVRGDVMKEVFRVLKPGGMFSVIEFKHELSGPPGPPLHVRISPDQVESLAVAAGFSKGHVTDIGPCVYMAQFCKAPA